MKNSKIIVVGGGPAGCVVATLLAEAGNEVTVIDRGVRPALVVGESLIPSVVGRLRTLGLEQRVAKFGRLKPGAAIARAGDFDWSIAFEDKASAAPTYAYNVPRKYFDAILKQRAIEAGCTIRNERCEFGSATKGVLKLKYPQNIEYDFIIDASGRVRLGAAALGIGAQTGSRKDIALFSHFDKADLPHGGSIHMNVFDSGWSWRIPLADRVSVGFVMSVDALTALGETDRERYTHLIGSVPIVSAALRGAVQLEDVYRYQNYQLVSEQMVGANWAMVGDAAGFVDPVFSSGLALSFDGAFMLAESLISGGVAELSFYEEQYRQAIERWQRLVDTFYDGRFFTMIQNGSRLKEENPILFERLKAEEKVAAIISGNGISSQAANDKFYELMQMSAVFGAPIQQVETRASTHSLSLQ